MILSWDASNPLQRQWIERVRAAAPDLEIREGNRLALIGDEGEEYEGAHAIYRALGTSRPHLLSMYLTLPLFGRVSDRAFELAQKHASALAWWTRVLVGPDVRPTQQVLVRFVFLRALGVASAIAFASLLVQLDGLFGPWGLAPAPGNLHRFAWTGLCASFALIVDVLPALAVIVAWFCYFMLVRAGGLFLHYQWDALLLESLLVGLFVAPFRVLPRVRGDQPPRRIGVWLVRLLVVKLMFLSGVVKLSSGDPTWRNLTALDYHYFTQPLPFSASRFVASFPRWMHHASVVVTFAIELFAPLLVFGPRRLRWLACALFVALQLTIATSGSYGFFNVLTIALSLTLLDDDALRFSSAPVRRKPSVIVGALAGTILFVSAIESCARVVGPEDVPRPFVKVAELAAPLRSVHAYGLFAVMTTTRREIEIEGSADGVTWKPYVFRYKPGPVERVPRYTWFHLPRLDWQLWFAGLTESCSESPWTIGLGQRLLEGSPAVLGLLEANPFPNKPPLFVRMTSWDYRFGRETFWVRRDPRPYCPTLTLQGGELLVVDPE